MKVTWIRDNEYSQMYADCEWQDRLAPSRGIINGVLISAGFWLMALSVWAWVKFGRYFA